MRYLVFTLLVLVVGVVGASLPVDSVSAANKNDFDPGYIIDDYVFYNSNAMDAGQIQRFLESKNPNCDYNGTQSASDWGYPNITHAQLAEYKRNGSHGFSQDTGFHAPPYRCMTHYSQATPQMEASSGYCGSLGAATRTAAQIINDIAKACGINPQVLIILLQKEQSLITDNWPLDRQLRHATGFACPDTAPCNPAYEGFFYQVYNAARQFKVYKAFPNSYNYRAGRWNNIYWNPDLGRCGSSSVYIQNQATAALYIYTPYRPNQAALDNLYGLGDSCSSYGNRNFWRMFTDWFGSTKLTFVPLDRPRWMTLKNNTYKVNIPTGNTVQPELNKERQILFLDKIHVNGKWYLRTEYDKTNSNLDAIPLDDIADIPLQSITAKWVSIPDYTSKVNPIERYTHETVDKMSAARVVDKVTVNNIEYYRTEYDQSIGNYHFIPVSSTEDFKLYDFAAPRLMIVSRNTQRIHAQTGQSIGTVSAGSVLYFNKRITIGGVLHVQASSDNGTLIVIKWSDLREAGNPSLLFSPLDDIRWMALGMNTRKINLANMQPVDPELTSGRNVRFIDKTLINGAWYLRTEYDKTNNLFFGIALDDLVEIQPTSMTPTWVSIPSPATKVDPIREHSFETVAGMTTIRVVERITVDGNEYYRTAYEQSTNRSRFIPVSATESFTLYSMNAPRSITTTKPTTRLDIQTGATVGTMPANTTRFYNRRITLDGTIYLQSQDDNGTTYVTPENDLY